MCAPAVRRPHFELTQIRGGRHVDQLTVRLVGPDDVGPYGCAAAAFAFHAPVFGQRGHEAQSSRLGARHPEPIAAVADAQVHTARQRECLDRDRNVTVQDRIREQLGEYDLGIGQKIAELRRALAECAAQFGRGSQVFGCECPSEQQRIVRHHPESSDRRSSLFTNER